MQTKTDLDIIAEAADICAREHLAQYGSANVIPETWTGDMYDADLDYAAEKIGRPLDGHDAAAFDRAFRGTFRRLSAAYREGIEE